jgi:hypothetical protein
MKGRKTGGRRPGSRNKKTIFVTPKTYPDGLDHLAAVIASTDGTATPDMKLKAAIAIAAYQHAKPAPSRHPTPFELPRIEGPADLPRAAQAVLAAAAKGDLALGDANDAIGILNGLRQTYETADLAAQLREMREQFEDLKIKAGV